MPIDDGRQRKSQKSPKQYIQSPNIIACMLVAWLSGNALVSINEVTLCQARLVLGWVTVCVLVNHLGI